MKVLHFDLAAGFRGGQRQALLLHRNLLNAGIDSLLAVDGAGRLREKAAQDGIAGVVPLHVPRIRPDALARLSASAAVVRLLQRTRPNIVHFHEPASLLYGPLAGAALRVETRRVSFPIKPMSVRLKYRPLDLHVGVSEEISGYLRGLGLAPVHTVHSGIDLARFQQPPTTRPLADNPHFKLLYVGAFHKMKGIEVLLAAFCQLTKHDVDGKLQLHLVGDGELLPAFKRDLEQRGLVNRAVFHGFREDTEAFLADADAVVVPSTYGEGSNGMIKEALAAGRPVIASDLACNAELMEAGVDGLLFRNSDASDLAQKVTELQRGERMFDPDRLRATAARFSDTRMSSSYLDLYQRYLAQRGLPRR
ncbi:MAG: glycosyltransferase [Pseudomarimonas sp.]